MSSPLAPPLLTLALVLSGIAAAPVSAQDEHSGAAASFASENDAAMRKMMADMHVQPMGDVDQDFIRMMIPHHQGAIDMCAAQLRHGRSDELKAFCRQIIAEQTSEIGLMRRLINSVRPAATSPGSSLPTHPDQHAHGGK